MLSTSLLRLITSGKQALRKSLVGVRHLSESMEEVAELSEMLDTYRDLCRIPEVVGGRLRSCSQEDDDGMVSKDTLLVEATWCQRDLTRNEKVKFTRNYAVMLGNKNQNFIPTRVLSRSTPSELNKEIYRRVSGSGAKVVVLRKVSGGVRGAAGAKTPEASEYLEIWDSSDGHKECTVNLTAAEKHGKLHVHEEVGLLQWSHGEGHLLYVAENLRKNVGFFEPKFDPDDEEALAKKPPGMEYEHVQHWGEQLTDVKDASLCVIDVPSGNISVLEGLPKNILPTNPVWTPDDEGILFIGYDTQPFKLGKIFCVNRKASLYHYRLAEGSCEKLGEGGKAMNNLRFSPDGSKFVFLERDVGGPHYGGFRLISCDWASKTFRTVVDLVNSPADPETFPGIYGATLPQHCWANDQKRILFSSVWNSKTEVLVVDVESGGVKRVTNCGGKVHGSWGVLDVWEDYVLVSSSAPNRPPCLLLAKLPPPDREETLVWLRLTQEKTFKELTSLISWTTLGFRREATPEEKHNYVDCQYEALVISPCHKGEGVQSPRPLIVIPHGGPHSVYVANWLMPVAFFVSMGYVVLRINYRGSAGFGEDNLRSLPGNVGTLDVKDCQHAVETVLEAGMNMDKNQIVLYGGSHGGFLVTHLVGQYPDFYKAGVSANGVINLATMYSSSDIPDWIVYEGLGKEYDHGHLLTPAEMEVMWNKSPIRYADKVRTPLLFLLGGNDKRVPSDQSNEYRRILKVNNVPHRVLFYPTSHHGIDEVDTEGDELINTVRWFEKHLPANN